LAHSSSIPFAAGCRQGVIPTSRALAAVFSIRSIGVASIWRRSASFCPGAGLCIQEVVPSTTTSRRFNRVTLVFHRKSAQGSNVAATIWPVIELCGLLENARSFLCGERYADHSRAGDGNSRRASQRTDGHHGRISVDLARRRSASAQLCAGPRHEATHGIIACPPLGDRAVENQYSRVIASPSSARTAGTKGG